MLTLDKFMPLKDLAIKALIAYIEDLERIEELYHQTMTNMKLSQKKMLVKSLETMTT